ncbi:hypothetical protein PCE1_000317 [Barthelona sp. PCE]
METGSTVFVPQGTPKTSAVVQDNRRKIHSSYPDNSEMVEEFDINTNRLLLRKWRRPTMTGRIGDWIFEVGEPVQRAGNVNEFINLDSDKNPYFFRSDTDNYFVFRVRNCPWDIENFNITVSTENDNITIRTNNRKYYKKFSIPDLTRNNVPLNPEKLSVSMNNHTLILKYKKPSIIRQQEEGNRRKLANQSRQKTPKDGDVQCPTQ